MRTDHPFPSFSLVLSQQHAQSPSAYLVFPWSPIIYQDPIPQPAPNANPAPVTPQIPHAPPQSKLKRIIRAIRPEFVERGIRLRLRSMVQVGHLTISPPLVNASCAWASDFTQLQALFDSPYTGAVTTRTSTLQGFAEDASHTVAFATSSISSLNSYGYSPHKLEQYLSWIETILSEASTPKPKPFLISITASSAHDLHGMLTAVKVLRSKSDLFANNIGIELNTSCPNIRGAPPSGYAPPSLAPLLKELAEAWKEDNSLTIGLKLPPYVHAGQFAELLDALREHSRKSIAYLACTNTLGNALLFTDQVEPGAGKASDAFAPAVPTTLGGVAGDALHALALGNVYSFAELLKVDPDLGGIAVIGIGGVTSAAAAKRMSSAGAAIIGCATLLGKEGVRAFEILSKE
ncbi:hypothetical protein C8R43DRAFT_944362 [Mycena crocata]|nr:hypothetical protein C8R43DRAFT_944362 [Mycena crocata]